MVKYEHPLFETEEYKLLYKEVKEEYPDHEDYVIMLYCLSYLKQQKQEASDDIIKSLDIIDNEKLKTRLNKMRLLPSTKDSMTCIASLMDSYKIGSNAKLRKLRKRSRSLAKSLQEHYQLSWLAK
jgi:hypothetical protein